jgi:Tol biopolymer transport system component
MRRALWAAALLAGLTPAARLPAQEYFGQNQVQYEKFDWRVLETEHFQVHFYQGLEKTANIAGSMAERTYARLSRVLGHQFREKKPIVVFASRTDFAQNNIFGDPGEGVGGVTDWLRQRNTLYFIGDYGEFDHVLAHEMVHVFQYDIFSRGRAGANIQSIARVQPPGWFMEGMAEYLSVGPEHPHTDAVMRDAALNGRVPTVEDMTRREDLYFPYRFGASLWQYVGGRWGDAVIGDIMNGVPSVGIERAFRRELGLSMETLSDEWREAVQERHLPQIADRQRARRFAEPLLNEERTGGASKSYVAPTLSPDGKYVAFLSAGSYLRGEVFPDLYLAETETGKRIARLTKSTLNADYEELRTGYSQSAFSPDGRFLAFTTQRRGRDILVLLDVQRRETVRSFDRLPFEQMIGPTFSPDGRRIAFVGATGAQSDVYVMDVDGGNLRRLTNDVYGDAQPAWSPDGRYIAVASERGPQSDLAQLRFGKWRISLVELESGRIEVIPGQDGRNLNPQWSPDSRAIAYISDRTGIANIFLYDLAQREHFQLTDVFSSVSSFTEISPAMSWARQADRLAFVYYENGDYSVWSINDPRRLKGQPFRPAAATAAATAAAAGAAGAAGAARDSAGRDSLARPPMFAAVDSLGAAARRDTVRRDTVGTRSVLLDSLPERLSVYRAAGGLRRADTLAAHDRAAGDGLTVAALLDSATLALPDTATFRVYDYKAGFRPEYVSQPTIGYTQDDYVRGVVGGTTVVLSDLLGNHRLALGGAVNGRIEEAQLLVAYANFAHRLQYVLGATQSPYYYPLVGYASPLEGGGFLEQREIVRYIWREAFATAVFPRNRFSRVEFGARVQNLEGDRLVFQRVLDPTGYPSSGYQFVPGTSLGTVNLAAPFAAYVSDNALMGYTAPILGRRFRFQLSPTVGTWKYMEYLADYRRYDPILFNVLTVATRASISARVGGNEAQLPPNILHPQIIRGYDRQYYNGSACAIAERRTCVLSDELQGSRVAVANAELRFPVVRRFDLGILPISLPPVDGHLFYDAGIAWQAGQRVLLRRSDIEDPNDRSLLSSWGAGFRLNLFGFAILRMDYVIPLATPDHTGHWSWILGGYGF